VRRFLYRKMTRASSESYGRVNIRSRADGTSSKVATQCEWSTHVPIAYTQRLDSRTRSPTCDHLLCAPALCRDDPRASARAPLATNLYVANQVETSRDCGAAGRRSLGEGVGERMRLVPQWGRDLDTAAFLCKRWHRFGGSAFGGCHPAKQFENRWPEPSARAAGRRCTWGKP
jgi:hypothetical protein